MRLIKWAEGDRVCRNYSPKDTGTVVCTNTGLVEVRWDSVLYQTTWCSPSALAGHLDLPNGKDRTDYTEYYEAITE